MVDLLAD